jgi:hypothetical protein
VAALVFQSGIMLEIFIHTFANEGHVSGIVLACNVGLVQPVLLEGLAPMLFWVRPFVVSRVSVCVVCVCGVFGVLAALTLPVLSCSRRKCRLTAWIVASSVWSLSSWRPPGTRMVSSRSSCRADRVFLSV